MLVLTGAEISPVVLVRRDTGRRVHELAAVLVANVSPLEAEVVDGCTVVVEADRVRVRLLPSSCVPHEKPAGTHGLAITRQHYTTLRTPCDLRFRG